MTTVTHIPDSRNSIDLIWSEAITLEPRLIELEESVRLAATDPGRPDFGPTYRTWKEQFEILVGWHASNPELRTQEFYHACFDRLLAVYEGHK